MSNVANTSAIANTSATATAAKKSRAVYTFDTEGLGVTVTRKLDGQVQGKLVLPVPGVTLDTDTVAAFDALRTTALAAFGAVFALNTLPKGLADDLSWNDAAVKLMTDTEFALDAIFARFQQSTEAKPKSAGRSSNAAMVESLQELIASLQTELSEMRKQNAQLLERLLSA